MVFLRLLPRLAHLPAVSLGSCVCLLAILLLTSCSSASTATGGPAPVTRPLAPPPQHCAIQPPPEVLHLDSLGANNNVQLVGGGPFWIYGFFYHSVLHLAQCDLQTTLAKSGGIYFTSASARIASQTLFESSFRLRPLLDLPEGA